MWGPDTGVDVTSAFKGITTPMRDLIDEVHKRGWTVKNVKWTKDQFEAEAQNPDGQKVTSGGNTEQTAMGNLLVKVLRTEHMRFVSVRVSVRWPIGWEAEIGPIAQAYAEANIYDPKAAGAWQELANDSISRARILHQQLEVEVTDDPTPYKSLEDMAEDVTKKRHILLSRANADHPIWSVDQILAYRLVHDVLGHVAAGSTWGWHGENLATQAHMPLLGPEAQKALFVEAIAQTAYGTVYRTFGPQKIVFLNDFIEKPQEEFNKPGHGGVHPSQSITPSEIPKIEPTGPKPKSSSRVVQAGSLDPNDGWSSDVNPLPDNAFLWHRDPQTGTDPLDPQGASEALSTLDTGWEGLKHPDTTDDRESQKQAVVNALRSVLLRPRKPEKWAAIHYQHVAPVAPSVSDPKRFADTLEHQREGWNQMRGLPAGSHAALYMPEMQKFRGFIRGLEPTLDDGEVNEKTEREFQHMWNEEEERVLNDDPDHQLGTNDVAKAVGQNMKKRLRILTKPTVDQKYDFGDRTLYHASEDPEVYQHWLGNHLNSLAEVGRHANELTDAALSDMRNHGGHGHHWRHKALELGVPGLGPEEASHAWLHLSPHTSQLATIDPYIMEVLDHKPEEMSERDYFKYERELAAGRDAAGYNHVPLGTFTQGLWDQKNFGPGIHNDYSHFRPLNPTPHSQLDLDRQPTEGWSHPDWWTATQPAREAVGEDFDRTIGTAVPKDAYPFQFQVPELSAVSSTSQTPWYVHDDGTMIEGEPGQPLMQHIRNASGLSTEEIWAKDYEAGKA